MGLFRTLNTKFYVVQKIRENGLVLPWECFLLIVSTVRYFNLLRMFATLTTRQELLYVLCGSSELDLINGLMSMGHKSQMPLPVTWKLRQSQPSNL